MADKDKMLGEKGKTVAEWIILIGTILIIAIICAWVVYSRQL